MLSVELTGFCNKLVLLSIISNRFEGQWAIYHFRMCLLCLCYCIIMNNMMRFFNIVNLLYNFPQHIPGGSLHHLSCVIDTRKNLLLVVQFCYFCLICLNVLSLILFCTLCSALVHWQSQTLFESISWNKFDNSTVFGGCFWHLRLSILFLGYWRM